MDRIIEKLVDLWLLDVWVFSQWWMYAPLGIPIFLYLLFFGLKWIILTLPIWIPFIVISGFFKSTPDEGKKK